MYHFDELGKTWKYTQPRPTNPNYESMDMGKNMS